MLALEEAARIVGSIFALARNFGVRRAGRGASGGGAASEKPEPSSGSAVRASCMLSISYHAHLCIPCSTLTVKDTGRDARAICKLMPRAFPTEHGTQLERKAAGSHVCSEHVDCPFGACIEFVG